MFVHHNSTSTFCLIVAAPTKYDTLPHFVSVLRKMGGQGPAWVVDTQKMMMMMAALHQTPPPPEVWD